MLFKKTGYHEVLKGDSLDMQNTSHFYSDLLLKPLHFQHHRFALTWTEEPGGLQSMGSQRVGNDCR